jgi:hypothetical protein
MVTTPLPIVTGMRIEKLFDKDHATDRTLQSGLLLQLTSDGIFKGLAPLNHTARQNPVALRHSGILWCEAPMFDKENMTVLHTQGTDPKIDLHSRKMVHTSRVFLVILYKAQST